MLIEVILELFVAIVDAELLEGIHFKALKPEDVKHTNEFMTGLVTSGECDIDVVNDILEKVGVHSLSHGVTCVQGLYSIVGDENLVRADFLICQTLRGSFLVNAPQLASCGEYIRVLDF